MRVLVNKQFCVDFSCSEKDLAENLFVTKQSSEYSRYKARAKGNIVCYDGKVYVRTENEKLTKKLEETYANKKADWFLEMDNLKILSEELTSFDLEIADINPFFIPIREKFTSAVLDERFVFIEKEDILTFKEDQRITEAFCYLDKDPDQIGLGYYEDGKLKAICGANWNGKYTWEIGIEIIDSQFENRGIATELVHRMTTKIIAENPEILIVYSTSFSHVKSMDMAINAGFKLGWTEISFK